jgi:hypothetical protein
MVRLIAIEKNVRLKHAAKHVSRPVPGSLNGHYHFTALFVPDEETLQV